jgi:hypothetical protein
MHTWSVSQFATLFWLASQVLCAVCASVFATALVVTVSPQRFEGMTFKQRFVFVLWRYTLPAAVFSFAVYWLLFGRSEP